MFTHFAKTNVMPRVSKFQESAGSELMRDSSVDDSKLWYDKESCGVNM